MRPFSLLCVGLGWLILTTSNAEVLPEAVRKPITVSVLPKHETAWRDYQTVTFAHLTSFTPKEIPLSPYGGRMDRREKPTGFFHAKKLRDRWVLVDPEGYHFYTVGVNCLTPLEQHRDKTYAFQNRFGTREAWAEKTNDLIFEDLGFNTIGRWSLPELFRDEGLPKPYTLRLDIIGNFAHKHGLYLESYGSTNLKGDVLPVFHPDLPAHIDEQVKTLSLYRDDPWIFGVMSDNEIPLHDENILQRYLALDADDPGRQAALNWLKENGKTVESIDASDNEAFCYLVLDRYFSMVHDALEKYLPNHMYFGTRFHKTTLEQESAYEAAGPYMDVIAINLYHRWNIDQEKMNHLSEIANTPLMITEWYAKGEDSGLRNVSGAGFLVETQADRGRFYENFTISLLRNPNFVGWHWFRYQDEGPLHYKHQASNKGIVDVHYQPYEPLAQSMRVINENVYALRDYLLPLKSDKLPERTLRAE